MTYLVTNVGLMFAENMSLVMMQQQLRCSISMLNLTVATPARSVGSVGSDGSDGCGGSDGPPPPPPPPPEEAKGNDNLQDTGLKGPLGRWRKEECVYVKRIAPQENIVDDVPCDKCWPYVCRKYVTGYGATTTPMFYLDVEPYSGDMFRTILKETVEHCCWEQGVAPKIEFEQASNLSSIIGKNLELRIEGINYIERSMGDQFAHFIFPVLGNRKSEKLHGHFFIPIFNPPGAFYITRKRGVDFENLIQDCVALWPLLLLCIVMASIAGFVAWLFETRKNKDEFPRSFFRGWFEGTWWSFISMTTVGYGDRVPRYECISLFKDGNSKILIKIEKHVQ